MARPCGRILRYDLGRGQFTQEDPIGLAGGLNLYGYAGGDPINYADPFGLAAGFRGLEAQRLWKSLQSQAVTWALSDDKEVQERGTKLLGMMNRLRASDRVVTIGVDDPFGSGNPSRNRTGPFGDGLGINVSMGQYGAVSLTTKLAHELGHAYAVFRLGMPVPDAGNRSAIEAHDAVADQYEDLHGNLPRASCLLQALQLYQTSPNQRPCHRAVRERPSSLAATPSPSSRGPRNVYPPSRRRNTKYVIDPPRVFLHCTRTHSTPHRQRHSRTFAFKSGEALRGWERKALSPPSFLMNPLLVVASSSPRRGPRRARP